MRNAELTRYHQPEELGEGPKGRGYNSPYVLPACRNPPWNPSWLRDACTSRKDPKTKYGSSKMTRQRRFPEAFHNPITIKSDTMSHVAEQFSWVPLHCFSPPGHPFPMNSVALSVPGSPQTIHFQMLGKSPLLILGRAPPSCNKGQLWWDFFNTIDHSGTQGPARLLTNQTRW